MLALAGLLTVILAGYHYGTRINFNREHQVGDPIDSLNGVAIYFNGGVNNVVARNLSADGYNLGLSYQCVEFVKRYYFERFGHRMPDPYGNAKDFFDPAITDGMLSPRRALLQFSNGSLGGPPQADDILVFGPSLLNPYGHVAIISAVTSDSIEIAQQNPGPFTPSRETLPLRKDEGSGWSIDHSRVRGWLRRAHGLPLGVDPQAGDLRVGSRTELGWERGVKIHRRLLGCAYLQSMAQIRPHGLRRASMPTLLSVRFTFLTEACSISRGPAQP